jgi:hypothetical protein
MMTGYNKYQMERKMWTRLLRGFETIFFCDITGLKFLRRMKEKESSCNEKWLVPFM